MSMNPGATIAPSASMVRSAEPRTSPSAAMRPSRMPRSPRRAGAPVPSTSVPPRMRRSKCSAMRPPKPSDCRPIAAAGGSAVGWGPLPPPPRDGAPPGRCGRASLACAAMAETRTSTGIKALLPLYTVIFIGFVGYSLMITVFTPLILYGHMGIIPSEMPPSHRPILLGVLVSLYPLGQFFGSPVAGALSDRFGRKPTLLVSLIITTACYALLAIALANGRLALLMAASLLAGLAEANIVIAQSAIADVATDQARNRLFGYIYLSVSLAYIAGPLIGGKLADPSLVPWFTYATPFWAVFGLLLVTFLWTALLFRETRAAPVGEPIRYAAAFTNLLNVFTDRRLRQLYAINFLLYLAIYGFFRCYPMYIVDQFRLDVSRMSELIAWLT